MAPKVGGLVARMPLAVNFLLAARCFFAVLPEINSELILFSQANQLFRAESPRCFPLFYPLFHCRKQREASGPPPVGIAGLSLILQQN
jgi:hypothetical protein